MRAVRFDRYGGVDVLDVREVEDPVATPGRVLVAVKAAGINPGEIAIREGRLDERWPATFPSGEGTDFAGIARSVGEGVTAISDARDFATAVDVDRFRAFAHAMFRRGVYLSPSAGLHSLVSTVHTAEDVAHVSAAAGEAPDSAVMPAATSTAIIPPTPTRPATSATGRVDDCGVAGSTDACAWRIRQSAMRRNGSMPRPRPISMAPRPRSPPSPP